MKYHSMSAPLDAISSGMPQFLKKVCVWCVDVIEWADGVEKLVCGQQENTEVEWFGGHCEVRMGS